jgi:proteasome lid subunit RPN8/RPN11
MRARVSRVALDAIVTHAREAAPAECCGVLLGTGEAVVEAVRTRNVAVEPCARFVVDPKDHIDARRAARTRGLEVVGFYHSHPRSPAAPSETDRAEATYPEQLALIVSLVAEPPEVGLFRLDQSGGRACVRVPFFITYTNSHETRGTQEEGGHGDAEAQRKPV